MSKPVVVLFLASLQGEVTGGKRTLLDLLGHLDTSVVRPVVALGEEDEPARCKLEEAGIKTVFLQQSAILGMKGGAAFRLGWNQKLDAVRELLQVNDRVRVLAEETGADVVWGRNAKWVLFGGWGARRAGVPFVWDIGFELPSKGLVRGIHWVSLALSRCVVTQARAQPIQIFGAVAGRVFAGKFRSLMPGVALERRRVLEAVRRGRRESARVRILNLASISPRKNQRLLLEALKHLNLNGVSCEVRFTGPVADVTYRKDLEAYIRSEGLADRVTFLGWRDDVAELLQEADILALTSVNEGVPHAIREAMFARVPVVSTAVGGVPELLGDGRRGVLVPSGDVEALSRNLGTLARSPSVRTALAEEAYKYASNHLSQARWAKVYGQILAELSSSFQRGLRQGHGWHERG